MCARREAAPLMGAHMEFIGHQSGNMRHYEPERPGQFAEQTEAKKDRPWGVIADMKSVQEFGIACEVFHTASYGDDGRTPGNGNGPRGVVMKEE